VNSAFYFLLFKNTTIDRKIKKIKYFIQSFNYVNGEI